MAYVQPLRALHYDLAAVGSLAIDGPTQVWWGLVLVFALLASLLFATMSVCVKLASQWYGAGEVVFYRGLAGAVAIVLLVSFLSLGLRTGLIVALSIPLNFAVTFLFMYQAGIDLHKVSLGALIIALIQNGLALLSVPPAWSTAVTGIVIIVAVTLDYFIKRRA